MSEHEIRNQVVETARQISEIGLSPGRSGNVSVRFEDKLLITPSAMAYDQILPEDIVLLNAQGQVIEGERKPSSEWRFHCAVYANSPEAHAVVHCHSTYATTLACLGKSIPAFHYMVAVAGGNNIPCCGYATFGTNELSDLVVSGLKGRKACLMQNHGQIAYGESLESALELAREVEDLAHKYWSALQVGEPEILSNDEMSRVLDQFSDYRQP